MQACSLPKTSVWLAACSALALLFNAAPADAFVISEDPLEERSFSIGGALRSYTLWLNDGLLDSPFADPDDNPAALSVLALRPTLEFKLPELSFVVHDELTSTSSTLATGALGSTLPIGQGGKAPLWLPLEWSVVDQSHFHLENRIDWLFVRATLKSLSFTLGRQPASIGRGQIWTPEDLLAPFSPLDLSTEYKSGIDAARLDLTIADGATLLLLGSIGKQPPKHDFEVGRDGSAALGRFEIAVATLRLGALAGWVRGDGIGGVDLFVDLGHGSDLHGSGTVSYVPDPARRPYGRQAFNRAVFGTTAKPADKLLLTGELHYNGSGAAKPEDYLEEFNSERFAVGEAYNVGRLYAGVVLDFEVHPLLHALFSAISNLEDPSALVAPEVDYNLAQNAMVVLGAFIPIGRGPSYAAGEVTARSEFGLYPQIYHVDAKLFF